MRAVSMLAVPLLVLASLTSLARAQSSCDTSYLLPDSQASPSSVLSVASINAILTEHNNARRTVSPAASVMPLLTWDQRLADFAQEYVSGCPGLVHSAAAARQNATRLGFASVGESLAAGTSAEWETANGGRVATAAWVSERANWTYPNTCASGAVCGHYTQVIWAATTKVGCGYAQCPSQPLRNYWSCVYGTAGNVASVVAPYVQATATTGTAACQAASGATLGPAPSVPAYTGPVATLPVTTAPPSTSATPAPSPLPAGARVVASGRVVLRADAFVALVASAYTALEAAVKADLAGLLSVESRHVYVTNLYTRQAAGANATLTVEFSVSADSSATASAVQSRMASAEARATAWLTATKGRLTTAVASALAVVEASAQEATPTPAPTTARPTPPPTTIPAGTTVAASGRVRIAGAAFVTLEAQQFTALQAALRSDLAGLLEVQSSHVVLTNVHTQQAVAVSVVVVVEYSVTADAGATVAALESKMQSARARGSAWLNATAALAASVSSEAIAVTEAVATTAGGLTTTAMAVPTTPPTTTTSPVTPPPTPSPPTEGPTPQPSPFAAGSTVKASGRIRLSGSVLVTLVAQATAQLRTALRSDIAGLLSVQSDTVVITNLYSREAFASLSAGLVVEYSVTADASATAAALKSAMLSTQARATAWLTATKALAGAAASLTLGVTESVVTGVTATEAPTPPPSTSSASAAGRVALSGRVRIAGSGFAQVLGTAEAALRAAVRADIASLLQVEARFVSLTNVYTRTVGSVSLVVTFDVSADAGVSSSVLASRLASGTTTTAWLTQTQAAHSGDSSTSNSEQVQAAEAERTSSPNAPVDGSPAGAGLRGGLSVAMRAAAAVLAAAALCGAL